MGRKERRTNFMDMNKKLKTGTHIWRPVSKQSSPAEGIQIQVRTMQRDASTSVAYVQSLSKDQCSLESGANAVESISIDDRPTSVVVHEVKIHEEIMPDVGQGDQRGNMPSNITSIEVDASLIRFFRGKGDNMRRVIERETGTKIRIPSSKQDTSIVIEGSSNESVEKASGRVQIMIGEALRSPFIDYSHFISLPLAVHPMLVEKLIEFRRFVVGDSDSDGEGSLDSDLGDDDPTSEIHGGKQSDEVPSVAVKLNIQNNHVQVKMEAEENKESPSCMSNVAVKFNVEDFHVQVKLEADPPGMNISPSTRRASIMPCNQLRIDRSIFIKPKTFHLTVLMLKLWNKEKIAAAAEILQNISSEVNDALGSQPVYVKLKGLECMKGSPSKARVLYTSVEEIGGEGRLLRACQVIINAYVQAGLVLEKDAHQQLKLHATVMNVRHRKRRESRKRWRFESFDAREILKEYASREWGEYIIEEAHLSQRFDFDQNGYYHCCASIPLPKCRQP